VPFAAALWGGGGGLLGSLRGEVSIMCCWLTAAHHTLPISVHRDTDSGLVSLQPVSGRPVLQATRNRAVTSHKQLLM
jgi:hypothetical protein